MSDKTHIYIELFMYAFGDSPNGGFFELVMNKDQQTFTRFSSNFALSLALDSQQLSTDSNIFFNRLSSQEHAALLQGLNHSASALTFFNTNFNFSIPEQSARVLKLQALPHLDANRNVVWTGLLQDITQQKKLEEERYLVEIAIDHLTHGLIFADANNLIFKCNPAFTKITGYEPHEVIGKNCNFLQNENTDQDVVERIRACLKNNQEFHGVILNQRKDGTEFWNDLTITPVLNEFNQLAYSVAIMRDVTESKRLNDALLESQSLIQETRDKYADLYEFAPIGYLSLNEAGVVIDANWKARSMLGVKRRELGEVRFSQFLSDEDKRYWANQFNALLASNPGQEAEIELKIQQGMKAIDAILDCIRVDRLEPDDALVRVTIRDVTLVKETQRELVQKEGYQRSLIDNFPFMVWLKDNQGRFLTVNKNFAQNAGFNQSDSLIGKTDYDCWPYDLAQKYFKDDQLVMETVLTK